MIKDNNIRQLFIERNVSFAASSEAIGAIPVRSYQDRALPGTYRMTHTGNHTWDNVPPKITLTTICEEKHVRWIE